LTVPPCTENVEWNLINDPQPISDAQLAYFHNKWSNNMDFAGGRGNNRHTQPLHYRKIYYLGALEKISASLAVLTALITTLIFA